MRAGCDRGRGGARRLRPAGARVTERAAARGIACFAFAPKEYASKADYEREIVARLDAARVDLVCLAGYMRILSGCCSAPTAGGSSTSIPRCCPPSRGARDRGGRRLRGEGLRVTIHWVDATLDGGRIIAQRAFAYDGDDVREVERRVHEVEHELYVETIDKLVKHKIRKMRALISVSDKTGVVDFAKNLKALAGR